jgi:hypothetical protein
MDVALIVGVIATIVVIYIVYSNFFASRGASTLSTIQPGTAQQIVSAGKVTGANSSNYAFSVWMFVEDWGYSYGKKKMVLARGSGDLEMYLAPELNNFVFSTALTGGPAVDMAASGGGGGPSLIGCYKDKAAPHRAMEPAPGGKLMTKAQCETTVKAAGNMKYMGLQDANGAGESQCFGSNDLASVTQYGEATPCPDGGAPWVNQVFDVEPAGGDSSTIMSAGAAPSRGECQLENIPLQTWTNVVVVVQDRAVDMYLDGRLVKSCLFTGIPKTIVGSDFQITPDGGFMGYTAGATYYNRALGPAEVYSIYQAGHGGGSFWSSVFGSYGVRVSLVDGGKTVGSVQI